MSKYRILSLDGGGIRGITTTVMLQNLNKNPTIANWMESVDLIAGTSTGGLIALGLAYGLNLEDIRSFYVDKGNFIFKDTIYDDIINVGRIFGAEYDTVNLERVLKDAFGNSLLADLKKKVLITSFDLDNESKEENKRTWKPKLFHNYPGDDSDGDELVYKVGLYTSAAPTYFPSVDGYIDGGVYANNPSMCALCQTQDSRLEKNPPMHEVFLLSLGTGHNLTFEAGRRHDWGYVQWIRPLIQLMLDGTAGIADFECNQILGSRYHRLAPVFPPHVSILMDDVKKIPYMIDFANKVNLDKTIQWIQQQWQ